MRTTTNSCKSGCKWSLELRIWKLDDWETNDEGPFVEADGVTVWEPSESLDATTCASGWSEWASSSGDQPVDRYSCENSDGTGFTGNFCKAGFTCRTCYIDIEVVFAHTANTLSLSMTAVMSLPCDNESWGVSEVKIEYVGTGGTCAPTPSPTTPEPTPAPTDVPMPVPTPQPTLQP